MKVFILISLVTFVSCGHLHNNYLPPNNNHQRHSSSAFGGNSGISTFGGPQSYSSSSSSRSAPIPILKFAADNSGEGTYSYNYETGNSISAEETGEARGDGTKAHGSYSYISPEGEHISITYTADENGFVPHGSHIPTPPPIPEAILKSLQENAAAEARGIYDDGQYKGEGLNEGQYHGEGVAISRNINNNNNNGGYRY